MIKLLWTLNKQKLFVGREIKMSSRFGDCGMSRWDVPVRSVMLNKRSVGLSLYFFLLIEKMGSFQIAAAYVEEKDRRRLIGLSRQAIKQGLEIVGL